MLGGSSGSNPLLKAALNRALNASQALPAGPGQLDGSQSASMAHSSVKQRLKEYFVSRNGDCIGTGRQQ